MRDKCCNAGIIRLLIEWYTAYVKLKEIAHDGLHDATYRDLPNQEIILEKQIWNYLKNKEKK